MSIGIKGKYVKLAFMNHILTRLNYKFELNIYQNGVSGEKCGM